MSPIWRKIYDFGKQLFALTQKTENNQKEIAELRQEVKDLTAAVQHLYYEFQRLNDNMRHEHEKTLLKMENQMLRFERRLPSAKDEEE
jgi:chromosome segregation ATPase